MNTLEKRIRKIISVKLDVSEDRVTAESTFVEDLGADSLDTVELLMALEEQFNIEIPDRVAESLFKVGDLLQFIEADARFDTPERARDRAA